MTGARFAGYAAIFDRVDRGGDVIARGAFARSLKGRRAREIPLLWQHRPDRVIGVIETLAEDARGLRVIARIDAHAIADQPMLRQMAAGQSGQGLSFGYRVVQAEGSRPRMLAALEIVEISVVAVPMQPLARIHAVAQPAR